MAILSKAPNPPSSFRSVPNYASALWALRVVQDIESGERGRISEALRRALQVRTLGRGKASVSVPHYWAPFYHDGRGAVIARPGKWLVWFKDPGDDPRWGPGLPVLRREVRRLRKKEFEAGLKENRRRGPGNPFMYVRKVSGPAKANPFFERSFNRVTILNKGEVDDPVAEAIGDIIDRKLRVNDAKPFTKGTAKVRL